MPGPSEADRSQPAKAWLLMLLCGWLLCCSADASFAQTDSALDDYNFAIGLYQKSRWNLAADAFQEFLKQHGDHPKAAYARLYRGLSLVHLEKFAEARETLRDFVRRYPQSRNRPDAMYRVGECSFLLDELEAAETELSAFLKAYPDHDLAEWALPYLADTQLRLDKPQAALATFKQALERFPQSRMAEDAQFGLARAYEALEQSEAAIEVYQQLAADRSNDRAAQAQLNVGTLYYESGRFQQAAKAYLQLPRRFPESRLVSTARLNAGFAWYQLGEHAQAIEAFDAAATTPPSPPVRRPQGEGPDVKVTALFWKGVGHKALGQYEQAVTVLKQAFESQPQGPLAEDVLYQRADCELRRERYDVAQRLFLDVVERWPQSDSADDSLHFAAEAALLADDLDQADQLADRFDREYPDSDLWAHQSLLRGRLLAARGGEANLKAAVERFRNVLDQSRVPRTQSLARFYLARTLQSLEDHEGALTAVSPLAEQVKSQGPDSEFAEALILEGTSLLALKRYEAAAKVMSAYLQRWPQSNQASQALATRALAEAHRGGKSQAQADLTQLATQFPSSPLVARTTHQLAERAYEAKDWDWSAELFGSLAKRGADNPNHAAALSGRAWSLHQQKKYREAAAAFAAVIEEHPDDLAVASEAAYMRGQALQKAGDIAAAIKAFRATFETYAPKAQAGVSPNASPSGNAERGEGADKNGPARYAFLGGLQAARLLGRAASGDAGQQIDQADALYDRLVDRFPNAAHLDELLDEWALLNYNADRYNRSDEIFRRLVRETPDSDLADNARYSLAESDLNAGRLDAARQTFRELSTGSQSDQQVKENSLYRLIGISVEQSSWKEVVTHAETLLEQFPESEHRPYAEFSRAEAHLFLSDVETAQQELLALKEADAESTAAQAPWFPRVWVLLAETYYRQKQYEDAVATVEELRSRFPQARVLYQADEVLGRCHKKQAEFDKARQAFLRVVQDEHGRRTETAAKAQFLIAETYLLQKDYRNAQREYLKVYHLYDFPDWQGPALFQAAQCDEQLNQWSNAVKAYEDFLNEFPNSEFADKAKSRLRTARQNAEQ